MNYSKPSAKAFVERAAAQTVTLKTASRITLALILVCQGMLFGAARQVAAQVRTARTTRAGQLQEGAGDARHAFNGQSGAATRKATVNVQQLARQLALAPEPLPPASPKTINPPVAIPENNQPPGALPQTSAPGHEVLLGAGGDENVEPLVPSPPPASSFQALDDGLLVIPPDTHGAVGPSHVMTTLNDRIRFQTRTGTVINTITLDSFWASLQGTDPNPPNTFDPKVLYDRFNDRWMFTCNANAQSAFGATFIGVSQTNDPTGTWNLYRVNAAGSPANWADYPSIGFNRDWIVVQINLFTVAANAFVGPDIYVFNKANLYAGGAGNFTRFTGNNSGTALAITGGTWAPMIDQGNTSGTLYFVQNWNSTNAILRVSKLTGPVGSEALTPGITFPQAPNAWVNSHPLLGGGWAPQAGATQAVIFGTRITNNDARMQNVVFRNGSLWATHNAILTTTPLAPGTTQSAANPSNHTGAQWWELNPTIENNTFSTPLQFGRIEDPTANNCHNGTGGTIAGCTQTGVFYAFPTIAVNKHEDALIGFSRFSPNTWASAAYAFRQATDAANTMRDPVIFRDGQARYAKSGGGNVRWGDYSATMVDPGNDRNFWTIQEYADSRINADATSRWATWWAQVNVPAGPGDLLISEYRLRGPSGNTDEFIEIYNNSDAPFVVNTTDGSAGYSLVASDGVVRFTIPNGQSIPARGHYLATGPAYSLGLYPAGNGMTAIGDTSYATEIQDLASGGAGCSGNLVNGRGIALFNTATAGNFTLNNRIDAVGSVCEPDALYREGAGHPVLSTVTSNVEHSWLRNQGINTNGLVQDTGDNAADFLFADTNGTPAGPPQRLGAPGPENTTSPVLNNNFVLVLPLDPNIENNLPPNRVRDTNPIPPIPNASFGTLAFRKRVVNNSSVPITRLRFRIVDMTTFLTDAGNADLRALTSGPVVVTLTGGGTTTVQGTTLETPPLQTNGGGYNSTLSAGTITLLNPLPPGETLNIQFLLGLQQTGRFRFFVNVETLP